MISESLQAGTVGGVVGCVDVPDVENYWPGQSLYCRAFQFCTVMKWF